MADFTILRGYGVAFDRSVLLAETAQYERVDRSAFDRWLAQSPVIDIRWDDHAHHAPRLADSRDGTAGVFADSYGLGFWASIDSWKHCGKLREITTRTRPTDRCSIGGLRIMESHNDVHLDAARTTITSARITHIAITPTAAYGTLTGVWIDDRDLTQAPLHIQNMAGHWGEGLRCNVNRPSALLQRTFDRWTAALAAGKHDGRAGSRFNRSSRRGGC